MSSIAPLIVEIGPNPPDRLDKALARDVPEAASLSRSRLVKLIGAGAVSRGGAVLSDAKARVAEGDQIEIVVPAPQESHMLPEAIALDIRFEDDDLIVVNKPAGMVVHPAPGTPGGTLVNALMAHCGDRLSGVGGEKRPGIVHRIDKDTSGLLVVAKTDAAHHGLAKQFEAHSVARHYVALTHGVPDRADPRLKGVKGVNFEGGGIVKITTQLARHKFDRQKQAVVWTGGRHAVTRTRVETSFGNPASVALVDCWLETGRTHQIRVHMAHIGHALIGDPTYGGRRKVSERALGATTADALRAFPRQALHARSLGFVHPVTNTEMSFEAALPQDMASLVETLSTSL